MATIINFTDLRAWQEAHQLAIKVYKITDLFPQKELFVLTSQMRRCAISITSNIAEGFSRQSNKEKLQFYSIAKGSSTELQNQLLLARDIGYISNETFANCALQFIEVGKLLTGLIQSIKNRS